MSCLDIFSFLKLIFTVDIFKFVLKEIRVCSSCCVCTNGDVANEKILTLEICRIYAAIRCTVPFSIRDIPYSQCY